MSEFQKSLFLDKLKRLEELLNFSYDTEEDDEEGDILTPLTGSTSNKLSNSNTVNTFPTWEQYFDENEVYEQPETNFKFNTYYKKPLNNNKNPVIFICHHGAGSSGLTFAELSKSLQLKFEEKNQHKLDKSDTELPGLFLFDCRGHSQTALLNEEESDYSINRLSLDFLFIFEKFIEKQSFELDGIKPSFFFIGHSLGGSVLSKVIYEDYIRNQDHVSMIKGLTMLDIVEDAAVHSLNAMIPYLDKNPRSFKTLEECIKWHLDSKLVNNEESARISVPSYFQYDKQKDCYTWIADLYKTQPFWDSWFEGLSSRFVAIKSTVAKLLILSGHDNLDKPLMIGQMQGKYQLVVFQHETYNADLGRRQYCGHFVHEDCPYKVAVTLLDYVERNDISRSDKAINIKWGSMRS